MTHLDDFIGGADFGQEVMTVLQEITLEMELKLRQWFFLSKNNNALQMTREVCACVTK